MVQRYVRVKTPEEKIYYGSLQPDLGVKVLDAPPWMKGQPTELQLEPDTYELLAPCRPSKIVAVGKNYPQHAEEMGSSLPQEPLLFLKPPTTAIATHAAIQYPPQSQQLDYEGELALIVGGTCIDCPLEAAPGKIWGYTIANDVTARDLQQKDSQWTRAKGFDTFCPLGPWIVREISPGAQLQTFFSGNPQPVQSASIDEMIFAPENLVAYISQIMTLLPGDVILTGTPAGVGSMQVGDRVRIDIEGIGSLENFVVAKPS